MTDVQTALNHYWSDRSDAYDAYQQTSQPVEADRQAWERIWTEVFPEVPVKVLDLGTGSGYLALLLARLGHDVTGTDLADGMLERAMTHAARMARPPVFGRGDAVQPDYPDHSFDAVVNRYLMWTLRTPEVALRNWMRVIRPGGTLAIVDSTWFPHGLDASPTTAFQAAYAEAARAELTLAEASDIGQVAAVVEAAGFTDVDVTPLTELLDLDRQYGVAPDHEIRLQYLIQARRPH